MRLKRKLKTAVFKAMGYDEKLVLCKRPEQLENISEQSWNEINQHLGTAAHSLPELINQLSMKRYGHNVTVGDCFCGGGSVPFEAARMGCDTYASDLNPIAGLLTWASIYISGADKVKVEGFKTFQKNVLEKAKREIDDLGIETNELGEQALGYLYCQETVCPECGKKVPLLTTFVVGKRYAKVVAKLLPDGDKYNIEICSNVSDTDFNIASSSYTVEGGNFLCPWCKKKTPLSSLRGDRINDTGNVKYGLRQMQKCEYKPDPNDVFQDRLYAIRYLRQNGSRYYRAPNNRDLKNEMVIDSIISHNLIDWQQKGLIPNSEIENGSKTCELIRNRGWKYWHQLFSPRQLFYLSLLTKYTLEEKNGNEQLVTGILGINKCADFSSKLCGWTASVDISTNTFYNQALNPLSNWGERSFYMYNALWNWSINAYNTNKCSNIRLSDARNIDIQCDVWITDPPYADAVNYHELTEFFLLGIKSCCKRLSLTGTRTANESLLSVAMSISARP
jgi:putative DNA methylase